MPGPLLTSGLQAETLKITVEQAWTWGEKIAAQRCSVPFPKEGSLPHPHLSTTPSFSTLVVFKNYSSLLATLLCVASQGCYCPDSASSLIDQLLNVSLGKRQHLNFSWRANAGFLGFPALRVSPGAVTLKSSEQRWTSRIASTSLFAQKKWFHGASYPQNCWLQWDSAPSAGCLLLCQHRFCINYIFLCREGCSSFLPPPPTQAWMTLLWWHTSGSTKLGMRAEGRKNGRKRGREAATPLSAAHEHCPAVLVWEFLATQGETSGEGTGTDGWVDGNRHWACTQRMEEAVWDFYSLRPYSMLSPAVSQAFRCHSNHGGGSGVFRSLRYKDIFK